MTGGRKSPAYRALLALSALCAAAALLSLVPNPAASWPNILGYSSLCTFTPVSTLICALAAAIACAVRARAVRRVPSPPFVPIAAIALLAGALVWLTVAWAGVKARYADAASSASVEADE